MLMLLACTEQKTVERGYNWIEYTVYQEYVEDVMNDDNCPYDSREEFKAAIRKYINQ